MSAMISRTPGEGTAELTGAEALTASLSRHGVEMLWGIPGTHNLDIYAALAASGIRHLPARHEQGCAFAADGFARATGRPGVCLTTSGPAVLNAATALAQAWSDSVPLLLLAPGMPSGHPGRGNGHLHETRDLPGAMRGIVESSHRAGSVEEIPVAVAQAFATMGSGRPRPAYLEIPYDLLAERASVSLPGPLPAPRVWPAQALLERAGARLSAAESALIIAGGGCAGCPEALRAVAERLGAPVVSTFNGKGVISSEHPLSLGCGLHLPAVRQLVEESDVVLAVGTELAPADLWYGPLPLDGRLLRIDIDPVQALTNAAPEVCLIGDAGATLEGLLGVWRLEGLPHPGVEKFERAARWRERIRAEAHQSSARWAWLLEPLGEALGESGVLAGDSSMACYYGAWVELPAHRPRSFLYPMGYGTLGYGLPAGIGAKLGRPDDPVAVLIGDGGLMYTVAELAAAAQLELPLVVVVADNGGYGEIRDEMRQRGQPPLAVDLPSPDFAGLARALGCHGREIKDGEELPAALRAGFAADRPTVLHVRCA
jgi:thiamine pyrophosphate-dependent acetolactate synthase large subunit-like protein